MGVKCSFRFSLEKFRKKRNSASPPLDMCTVIMKYPSCLCSACLYLCRNYEWFSCQGNPLGTWVKYWISESGQHSCEMQWACVSQNVKLHDVMVPFGLSLSIWNLASWCLAFFLRIFGRWNYYPGSCICVFFIISLLEKKNPPWLTQHLVASFLKTSWIIFLSVANIL